MSKEGKMNPYDAYPDLSKISNKIYSKVKPSIPEEIQEEITSFTPVSKERISYSQDWHLYYKACRTQKQMFLRILKDAVDYLLLEQDYAGNGRPPVFFADIIKSLVIKAYHGLSSWTTESELRYSQSLGIIDNVYRKTSINKYMNSARTTKVLHELYKIIALPIAPIETQYAPDASGISNLYKNKKWVEVRLEKQEHKTFSKLHILSGTLTNVIVSAKVTEGTKHESPFLKELINDASKRFPMKEVSADSGYLSRKNCDIISAAGAIPFILPKKNVRSLNRGDSDGTWGKMIRLWKNHQMLFASHYHRRSNVESTFAMLKKRWMDYCRCKLPTTLENEILCKIVCHNSVVLSHALLNYDIQPVFMAN